MGISYIWLKILQPVLKTLQNTSKQCVPALYFSNLSKLSAITHPELSSIKFPNIFLSPVLI